MSVVENSVLAALLQQSLAAGNRAALTITSESMAPLLHRGDQVLLEPVAVAQLLPGDVVVVETSTALLTHRFWGVVELDQGAGLLTRGDRPLAFDAPVPASNLIGRVVARRRGGRELALQQGPGYRLNQALARLAWLEIRLYGGPASGPGGHPWPQPRPWPTATLFRGGRWPRLLHFLRRASYAWAKIMASLAGGRPTLTD